MGLEVHGEKKRGEIDHILNFISITFLVIKSNTNITNNNRK
jgi:hypothetical protein